MHVHQTGQQRNVSHVFNRHSRCDFIGDFYCNDVLALNQHDSIALALRRHHVPRPQTVYHDADYARFNQQPEAIPMSDGQPEFMEQAIALATENVTSGRGGPFGAVIVKDGHVLATGVNHVTVWNDPTAHAEVVAIRDACKRLGTFWLKDCDVYTSSEPCPMCLAAIYWSHCRAIYFGNSAGDAARIGFDDSFLYDEMRKPLDQRKIPIHQMLAEKAWESFAAWEASPNKIEY
jgi:tRNA(Arg) A34 adenosine deaminase TadA